MANKVNVTIDANVQGYVDSINQAKDASAEYTTETRKVADAQVNLMKELRAAKKEAQNLATGYAQLDEEAKNSAFGREMASQLNAASEQAAYFINLQGDIADGLKTLSSETATLDMLTTGFSTIGGVASASAGAIALFTGNEKDAQKAVVMFTTVQSALNAVTSAYNGIKKIQNVLLVKGANSAAINTAATTANTTATKAATVAQAAFNAVANANPYVLLATTLISVCAGLYAFCAATEDATDDQENLNDKMEEGKKRAEDLNKIFNDTTRQAHLTAERFRHLEISLLNMKDEFGKTAMIEEATKIMNEYGISVKNTDEAQQFMVKNGHKFIELLRAQGDAAAYAAVKNKVFEEEFDKLRGEGMSAASAALQAANAQAVRDLDDLIDISRSKIAYLQKQLGIGSGLNKNNKNNKNNKDNKVKIDYDKDSLEDLQNQLSVLQNKLKKKNQLKVDVDKTIADINKLKDRIEEKEIELGIKEPDPKKIPFTEAWYNEQIAGLEKKKTQLPIDAYVEREQLQKQIDSLKGKLKIELEGVVITGSQARADAWAGNTKHNINSINEAISELQKKLQDTDWSTMGGQTDESGRTAKTFDDYINKIQELKAELEPLQNTLEDAMLTPLEKAQKKMQKTADSISSVGNAIQATGELFSAVGELGEEQGFQVMGIVAKAVATVALSYAQALTTCKTWVDWLAFGATGLATMLSTISAIKSATAGSYAEGGIVPGSSYYGDRLTANVNSGELILNRHQQKNLFDLLDGTKMPQSGGTNVNVTGVIRGTDIVLVQKNVGKVLRKTGTNLNI